MSIEVGKEKNWGSRTGKVKAGSKRNLDLIGKLVYQGISNEILELAVENPEVFQLIASGILESRKEIKSKAEINKPKKVFSTKLGNLYQGDCISLMQNIIEDNSIDCIFADPPFNLSKNYGKGIKDQMKEEEYLEWTRVWLDLCCDKLKVGGSFFVYNIPKWSTYIAHHLNQKLEFKNWIAIDLTLSMPIPNKLYPSHYSLLYFVKGSKPNHFSPPRVPLKSCIRCGQEQNDYGGYKMKMNPEGLNLRDIWTDIPPVRHSKYKNRDANELSLKLLDRILDIATKEGDLVFDPFGGSGTTYIASELINRRWIGVELGDCEGIINRIKNVESERVNLKKYHDELNILFTDKAIKNRHKYGLPLDNFRISRKQIERNISN